MKINAPNKTKPNNSLRDFCTHLYYMLPFWYDIITQPPKAGTWSCCTWDKHVWIRKPTASKHFRWMKGAWATGIHILQSRCLLSVCPAINMLKSYWLMILKMRPLKGIKFWGLGNWCSVAPVLTHSFLLSPLLSSSWPRPILYSLGVHVLLQLLSSTLRHTCHFI